MEVGKGGLGKGRFGEDPFAEKIAGHLGQTVVDGQADPIGERKAGIQDVAVHPTAPQSGLEQTQLK